MHHSTFEGFARAFWSATAIHALCCQSVSSNYDSKALYAGSDVL